MIGMSCRTCYVEEVQSKFGGPRKPNARRRKYEGSSLTGVIDDRTPVDTVLVDKENQGRRLPHYARQLMTRDKSAFQIDGNLGLLAATHEMLMQSHLPGTLALLPALPSDWAASGLVKGLGARGDVTISMLWAKGELSIANLIFGSPHPWLAFSTGLSEDSPGYFSWRKDAVKNTAKQNQLLSRITYPKMSQDTKIYLASSIDAEGRRCAVQQGRFTIRLFYDWIVAHIFGYPAPDLSMPLDSLGITDPNSLYLKILTNAWPCQVTLCSSSLSLGTKCSLRSPRLKKR